MHAVTVQSGLQQRWVSHRTILSGAWTGDNPPSERSSTEQWLGTRKHQDEESAVVGRHLLTDFLEIGGRVEVELVTVG
jgi:hypothetical protein